MFFSFLSEYYLFYFNLHYIVYFSIFIYFYITFLMKRWITMKSNIALQISLHYSNHCTTIHVSFPMNKQCHRPYHESASNRGQIDDHALIIHISKFIHLKEKSFAIYNNEGRISISYTKVYPFRFIGGGGDFVREEEQNSARILIGTLETSGNSPGIDRIGSLYSNYGGRGKEADRSGHVRISPRNCFRGPHLVSCCWRGSVTSGMLLMRLPSSSSRAVIRRVLIWRQLWMRYVDLVWTDDGRF